MFVLLPRKQFEGYQPPAPTLPRVKSHHQEWVDACRGKGKTLSHFGYAAVLTESLLLGNVALRTGQAVEWDPVKMLVTNNPSAAASSSRSSGRDGAFNESRRVEGSPTVAERVEGSKVKGSAS